MLYVTAIEGKRAGPEELKTGSTLSFLEIIFYRSVYEKCFKRIL